MPLIRFGGGIVDARGSHAGNTFSRNAAGAIMRSRVVGVNPATPSQSKRQATIRRHVNTWSNVLTDAQRAAWRVFASTNPVVNRFGQTVTLSGQQIFVKLNCNITIGGDAPITSPPGSTAISAPTSFTLDMLHDPVGHVKVTASVTVIGANEVGMIFLSPPMSPGRNFISSQLRYMDNVTMNAPATLTSQYQAVFGQLPLSAGQRIFGRFFVRNFATGILSSAMQTNALWT